jgi:hypothetical protein
VPASGWSGRRKKEMLREDRRFRFVNCLGHGKKAKTPRSSREMKPKRTPHENVAPQKHGNFAIKPPTRTTIFHGYSKSPSSVSALIYRAKSSIELESLVHYMEKLLKNRFKKCWNLRDFRN